MRPAALFLVFAACCLVSAAHAARPHAARSLLKNSTAHSYGATAAEQFASAPSYNASVAGQNATLPSQNITAAGGNGTASGQNATTHSVLPASAPAAAALPPQHLFQHGRKLVS